MRSRILNFGLWIGSLLWVALLVAAVPSPGKDAAPQWHLLIEPKFIKHEVAWPLPRSHRTELVLARWSGDEFVFPKKRELASLNADLSSIQEAARRNASAELAKLTPEYFRNSKQVIEYATLASDSPLTASAALAPDFLKRFEPVFGPKILVAIPNRFCVFVFPALASDYRDYAMMVLDAYKNSAYPVSTEVFELSAGGLRAVGVYEEP